MDFKEFAFEFRAAGVLHTTQYLRFVGVYEASQYAMNMLDGHFDSFFDEVVFYIHGENRERVIKYHVLKEYKEC